MNDNVTPVRFGAATSDQTARQALLDVLGMLDENPDMKVVIAYDYPSDDGGWWSGTRHGGPKGGLSTNDRLGILSFAQFATYEHVTGR